MPLTDHLPPVPEPTAVNRPRLPVWLHATTFVVLSFALGMGGAVLGWRINAWCGLTGAFAAIAVPGVLLTAGFNAPIWSFLKCVPARCRSCGGRSWGGFAGEALHYKCADCGSIRETRVSAD